METRPEAAERQALPWSRPSPEQKPLLWARVAADALTFSRLVAGVGLALWPWQQTTRSLAVLFRWKLALWTADALDGALARRSQTAPSWLGRADIWIDALVTLCTGVALVRIGLLPAGWLAAWVGLCGLLYVARPVGTVLLVFMFPLHAALVVLAVAHRLPEAWVFLVWVSILAWVKWDRLKYDIDLFVRGLPEGPRRWVWSWLPDFLRMTPNERAEHAEEPEE